MCGIVLRMRTENKVRGSETDLLLCPSFLQLPKEVSKSLYDKTRVSDAHLKWKLMLHRHGIRMFNVTRFPPQVPRQSMICGQLHGVFLKI
jgi:hypothetical protein